MPTKPKSVPASFVFLSRLHPELPKAVILFILRNPTVAPVGEIVRLAGVSEEDARAILTSWRDLYTNDPCPCAFLHAAEVAIGEVNDIIVAAMPRGEALRQQLAQWYEEAGESGILLAQGLDVLKRHARGIELLKHALSAKIPPVLQELWDHEEHMESLGTFYGTILKAPACVRRDAAAAYCVEMRKVREFGPASDG